MSVDMRFKGTLVFGSARALKAALADLRDDEEGCLERAAVQLDDLRVDGKKLHVDVDVSAPASAFEDTCHLLEQLAEAADGGVIEAVHDPGEGPDSILTERITAGDEEEPDPEEVYREAVRDGDLAAIERYLAEGRSPTEMLGMTWSGRAVDRLIAAGADPRAGDDNPPLVWLAQLGKTEALERLLAAGADPEAPRGPQRTTALMMAAYHGKLPALRALLAAGADPNAADGAGNTALHEAVRNRGKTRRQVVQALLTGGANAARRNEQGETAADIAHRYGHADVLEALRSS